MPRHTSRKAKVQEGTRKRSDGSLAEIVRDVLTESAEPMTAKQIAADAFKRNLTGHDTEKNLYDPLSAMLKRMRADPPVGFHAVAQGKGFAYTYRPGGKEK